MKFHEEGEPNIFHKLLLHNCSIFRVIRFLRFDNPDFTRSKKVVAEAFASQENARSQRKL